MIKLLYKLVNLIASMLGGLLAATLQGAIFAVVKAAVDRGAAEATRTPIGKWPGDEGQQSDKSA